MARDREQRLETEQMQLGLLEARVWAQRGRWGPLLGWGLWRQGRWFLEVPRWQHNWGWGRTWANSRPNPNHQEATAHGEKANGRQFRPCVELSAA